MVFKVPSNPNHAMILFYDSKPQTAIRKQQENPSPNGHPPTSLRLWHKCSFREAAALQFLLQVQGRVCELPEHPSAFPVSCLRFYNRKESLPLLFTANPKINYSANWRKRCPGKQMTPRAKFLSGSRNFSTMLYDQKPLESDVRVFGRAVMPSVPVPAFPLEAAGWGCLRSASEKRGPPPPSMRKGSLRGQGEEYTIVLGNSPADRHRQQRVSACSPIYIL